MKLKNNVLQQFLDFGIGSVLSILIGMFAVPITTRFILPIEFGKSSLFSLMQTIVMLASMLAMDQAYSRFYNEEKDKEKLLFNVLIIPLSLSACFGVSIMFFWKPISMYLFDQEDPHILFMMIIYFPCLVLQRFILQRIRFDLRGKVYSFLSFIQNFIYLVFLLIFIVMGRRSFTTILWANILGVILTTAISLFFSNLNYKHLLLCKVDVVLLRQMFLFSLPLIPSSLLSLVMNLFDKIAIRNFNSFYELGLYASAFKIVSIFNVIQSVFTTAWIPIAYKWHEDKKEQMYFEAANIFTMSMMMIAFFSVVIMRNMLLLLLGPEYRNTEKIFVFLMYVPIFYVMGETTGLGIYFSKKSIYVLLTSILCAICNVIGNFILVPKYGAIGAAVSTAICYFLYFIIRTCISRHLWFKFDILKYLINISAMILMSVNILSIHSFFLEIVISILILCYDGILCWLEYGKVKNV